MRTGAFAVAFVVAGIALSGAAEAQRPAGPLFVSPMGEPFRGDHVTAPISTWFAAADQDGDGRISRAEFVAQALPFFQNTLDANRDGAVTSLESGTIWREQVPELAAARPRPVQAQVRPSEQSSGTPDPRARRQPRNSSERDPPALMAHFALFDIVEPVMSCDTDLSRRVTQAEYEACALRRFALLDTDADGYFAIEDSPRATALLQVGTPSRE